VSPLIVGLFGAPCLPLFALRPQFSGHLALVIQGSLPFPRKVVLGMRAVSNGSSRITLPARSGSGADASVYFLGAGVTLPARSGSGAGNYPTPKDFDHLPRA